MDERIKRKAAAVCLCLLPFMYWLGLFLYHYQFEILSRLVIMGWMAVSLMVGLTAALTYQRQIFGFNCGSFLCYSVPVITAAFTLQVLEHPLGGWLMYGFFMFSFIFGATMLWRMRTKKHEA